MKSYDFRWFGLLVGILIPFVGYAVLLMITEQIDLWRANGAKVEPMFDARTLLLLAICLNLLPFHRFNRIRWTQAMRGIILATLLYSVLWAYLFGRDVLGA